MALDTTPPAIAPPGPSARRYGERRRAVDRRTWAERREEHRLEERARRELRLATLAELRALTAAYHPAIPHFARILTSRLTPDWQRGSALLDRLEELA